MFRCQNLRKYRHSARNHFYAITINCRKRKKVFTSFKLCSISCQTIFQCNKEGLFKLIAFVIMPDHIHLIIQLNGTLDLPDSVKATKGRVASCLREFSLFNIWQKGYYERQIRDESELREQARYIIRNPIRAELITKVGNYPYWYCIWV
ncbi:MULTISPECIES: REP-associated tyrosine transposase [unclassified Pseudoalteromonas]|uniref:REP-associated tyrosine transposase n=1 Tax=unclassified Pseudoalteromonas TaxID=194690 RepID=UPI003015492E